jgi:hypothetical protein
LTGSLLLRAALGRMTRHHLAQGKAVVITAR